MSNIIKLENTSDAAIYLPHVPGDKEPFSNDVTIVPRAKREELMNEKTNEKSVKVTLGTAEIPVAVWERVKKNQVVATYLSSGRLRVAGSSGPPPESASPNGGKGQR